MYNLGMFNISYPYIVVLSDLEAIPEYSGFFDRPLLKSADTGLSYRKINDLDSKGLASNQRKTTRQWRSFSINEVALMVLTDKLRNQGVRNKDRIKSVVDFLAKSQVELEDARINKAKKVRVITAITALTYATGVEFYLVLTPSEIVGVFDQGNFINWATTGAPELGDDFTVIRLDLIVGRTLTTIDERLTPRLKDKDLAQLAELHLNASELKLLQLIQGGDYSSVEIKLGGGKIKSLSGVKSIPSESGGISIDELVKVIGEKQYGQITVQMEGGKMVYLNETERLKVS